MDSRQRADLDRYITGNWGEDSVPPEEDEMLDAEVPGVLTDGWVCGAMTAAESTCNVCQERVAWHHGEEYGSGWRAWCCGLEYRVTPLRVLVSVCPVEEAAG